MCLAVPGKLETILSEDELMPMGRVRFGGVHREVCLACVPDVQVGDYVLVHVGMAISVVDEAEAQRVFALLGEVDPEALAEVADVQKEAANEVADEIADEVPANEIAADAEAGGEA